MVQQLIYRHPQMLVLRNHDGWICIEWMPAPRLHGGRLFAGMTIKRS